jgi:glycogen operon protein
MFLSQGVPMLLGGDELGRTQDGNNNAYCQDQPGSWYDWQHADERLLEFTQRLTAFRADHPVFRRRQFFQGRPIHGEDLVDIEWFTTDGVEMAEEHWGRDLVRDLGVLLSGDAIPTRDERGEPIHDDTFYLLFNARSEGISATLPVDRGQRWQTVLDTATDDGFPSDGPTYAPGDEVPLTGRSVVVLVQVE